MKKLLFSIICFTAAFVQCSLNDKLTTHQAKIKTMKVNAKAGTLPAQSNCYECSKCATCLPDAK